MRNKMAEKAFVFCVACVYLNNNNSTGLDFFGYVSNLSKMCCLFFLFLSSCILPLSPRKLLSLRMELGCSNLEMK